MKPKASQALADNSFCVDAVNGGPAGWEVMTRLLQGLQGTSETGLERGPGRRGPSLAKRALQQHPP